MALTVQGCRCKHTTVDYSGDGLITSWRNCGHQLWCDVEPFCSGAKEADTENDYSGWDECTREANYSNTRPLHANATSVQIPMWYRANPIATAAGEACVPEITAPPENQRLAFRSKARGRPIQASVQLNGSSPHKLHGAFSLSLPRTLTNDALRNDNDVPAMSADMTTAQLLLFAVIVITFIRRAMSSHSNTAPPADKSLLAPPADKSQPLASTLPLQPSVSQLKLSSAALRPFRPAVSTTLLAAIPEHPPPPPLPLRRLSLPATTSTTVTPACTLAESIIATAQANKLRSTLQKAELAKRLAQRSKPCIAGRRMK